MKRIQKYYKVKNELGFNFTMPSETIPGQAMTIREHIERFKQGERIPVYNEIFGEDDEVLPLFKQNFDLTDIDDIGNAIKRVEEYNVKLSQLQKVVGAQHENTNSIKDGSEADSSKLEV